MTCLIINKVLGNRNVVHETTDVKEHQRVLKTLDESSWGALITNSCHREGEIFPRNLKNYYTWKIREVY